MKVIWLIAWNYVLEQRMGLLVFLIWIVVMTGVFGYFYKPGDEVADLQPLFKQFAVYSVVFSVITCSSFIANERKNRRILAVLAKGIYRAEYIVGILIGNVILSLFWLGLLGLSHEGLALVWGYKVHIWATIGAGLVGCLLASALTLVFATFMHPFFAAASVSIVAGVPLLLARYLGEVWLQTLPIAYVVLGITRSTFKDGWTGSWWFVGTALVEVIFFLLVAAAIFDRRDVTVATE